MIKKILRFFTAVVSLFFLCWFIAPFFWNIRHIGCYVGIILCAAIFFRSAFSPFYHRIKDKMASKTPTKVLLRFIQIISTAIIVYCVVVSSFMVYAMIPKTGSDNATAIVLGAQVKPWGPSAYLQQRINAAEKYLDEHPNASAVVSSGQGDDEPTSEAQCIYDTMVNDNGDAKRIYREDKANDTDENLRFSLEIIRENDLEPDIAIVTDSYHQLRAKLIADKIDSSLQITPGNSEFTYPACIASYPSYFVREWLALPVELLK